MNDPLRTNQELLEEISALKQRISELEQSESERKRTEEALRENVELNHAIFKEALNPILVTNENGEYINANAAALSFLETDLSKLLGKTVWEFSPNDLREQQQHEHSPFSQPRTLETDYEPVVDGFKMGDIVLFMKSDTQAIHSAIYIADDILFTKNGPSQHSPWILMQMETLVSHYETNVDLKIRGYRKKPVHN